MKPVPQAPLQNFAHDDSDYLTQPEASVSIRRPLPRHMLPGAARLFEPGDLEASATGYDLIAPGSGMSSPMLESQNAGLLAFRNRTDIITKKMHTRSFNRLNAISALGVKQAPVYSTLLNRRPLGKLRDPADIPALERVRQHIDDEQASLDFQEDPVAYFSKRKDGRGHRFIYLSFTRDPSDIDFCPYDLKKVPSVAINGDYFTMSASGITHCQSNGLCENMSLDQWSREVSIFNDIRKLNFFQQYWFWKSFRIWKQFVLARRYQDLHTSVISHPFFKNPSFFAAALGLFQLRDTCDALLKQCLLAIHREKKYSLKEFEATNAENTEALKAQFSELIVSTQRQILDLYQVVSNPVLVQVKDSDFPDIRRRNPNLGQLMIIEYRKAASRASKTEDINREIVSIGAFVRMVDYMLIESLSESCVKCWKIADSNVSQSDAAIFQVEVMFDDEGKVTLMPLLNELTDAISRALEKSIVTLNSLPRLLMSTQLRPLLRDNGLDVPSIYECGAKIATVVHHFTSLEAIESHMIQMVTDSYRRSLEQAQSFREFYPIYQLGQSWSVMDYLVTRGRKRYQGTISGISSEDLEDQIFMFTEEQPIIDFEKVITDLKTFKEYAIKVAGMKPGDVRGALYIDARRLHGILIPIPAKGERELQALLKNLAAMKVDQVTNCLKYYNRQLKQEPKTLGQFVEYCRMWQRTIDFTPRIAAEIKFVDDLYQLFDEFGMQHGTNFLNTSFTGFKSDQQTATQIRSANLATFGKALKDVIRETERRIDHFTEKATAIPAAMKDADIENRIPAANKLCSKIAKLEPRITQIIQHQTIMGADITNFASFQTVQEAAAFTVSLYAAVGKWESIPRCIQKTPFSDINIAQFKAELSELKDQATDLQENAKLNYPILNELVSRVNEIFPYLGELEMLSQGKMQVRHWNALFEECQQHTSYSQQTTIADLLQLGILKMREQIEHITSTSQGESELEADFQKITNHWNKVQLAVVEQPIRTDDNLLLAPTDNLLADIYDAIATLQNMLSLPFVQGVREAVVSLLTTLEHITLILDAWRAFQSNWIVLSALFTLDEARTILPHQANRLATVQRKWVSITRHALKDTRLFSVCAYPSLLEVLNENNGVMDSILTALGKFLEAKRAALPRLFFLSNDEVLALCLTNQFILFNATLPKLFMKVISVDCREGELPVDGNSVQNFQRLKIFSITGEDCVEFKFTKWVSCIGGVENWLAVLINTMHHTVRENIVSSIGSCQNAGFADWVLDTPPYIAFTVLNIVFTKEIDEAFSVNDGTIRAFAAFDKTMNGRFDDLVAALTNTKDQRELFKFSTIMVHLIGLRDRGKSLSDRFTNHSPHLEWQNTLKFRMVPNTNNQVSIEFADFAWEHEVEYWGKVPAIIHTESTRATMLALLNTFANQTLGCLIGTPSCGRSLIASHLACSFGVFQYIVRPFPDVSEYFLSRLLTGAASSGSWVTFADIDCLPHQHLCYLFDHFRMIALAQTAGNHRVIISSKLIDLAKNCRIILTSGDYRNKENFPGQLRSFIRPISLVHPSVIRLIEVKLISLGFKNAKLGSEKTVGFVVCAVRLYRSICQTSQTLFHLFAICEAARTFLTQFQTPTAEYLSLACASFEHFRSILHTGEIAGLMSLLFSAFRITGSQDELAEKIKQSLSRAVDDVLQKMAVEEIMAMKSELPSEYLMSRMIQLYHLLEVNKCVVILGPPISGKSTILKMLEKILDKGRVKNLGRAVLKPFKVEKIFQGSETIPHIFGCLVQDASFGQTWQYGQLQAVLCNFLSKDKSNTDIVVFDGSLSQDLSCFLTEFLGTIDDQRWSLNSLDSFKFANFKVIIETDSLANVTPGLLAKSAILTTTNIQHSAAKVSEFPTAELIHPTLPFARAVDLAGSLIKIEVIPIIRSMFCEVAPIVVKRVYHTKNLVCHSEGDVRVPNGHILLSEVLPTFAGVLAIRLIYSTQIDCNEDKQVKMVMVIAFFRIFANVIEPKEVAGFDTWLRSTFVIDVPPDWVGYSVPDQFWNIYKRPSLQSMRVFRGKLIPLDFSRITDKPMVQFRGEGLLPIMMEDICVVHAQMLPVLECANALMAVGAHFIVHGPPGSGKTAFVQALLYGNDAYTPVWIPSSRCATTENLLSLLATHTNLVSKVQIARSQVCVDF
jgi:energy-coupling factor transporter ATP-binding protein EcfA2